MPRPTTRAENHRDPAFHPLFDALPRRVQAACEESFEIFLANPNLRGFRLHPLKANHRGSHLPDSWSVEPVVGYRAIFFVRPEDGRHVWYWIGTHADYDRFTGVKA
ncbi:MAG: hypothetical protein ACRC1K_18405 [Planctomycetia bacterium]